MANVHKHPLDFERLEKNTIITQDELEEIFGCTPEDTEWPFRLMTLQSQIRSRAGILVKVSRNTLILMDDKEAAEYNFSYFRKAMRRLRSSAENIGLIDAKGFSVGERSRFDSQCRIISGTQQATRSAFQKQARVERLLRDGVREPEE